MRLLEIAQRQCRLAPLSVNGAAGKENVTFELGIGQKLVSETGRPFDQGSCLIQPVQTYVGFTLKPLRFGQRTTLRRGGTQSHNPLLRSNSFAQPQCGIHADGGFRLHDCCLEPLVDSLGKGGAGECRCDGQPEKITTRCADHARFHAAPIWNGLADWSARSAMLCPSMNSINAGKESGRLIR